MTPENLLEYKAELKFRIKLQQENNRRICELQEIINEPAAPPARVTAFDNLILGSTRCFDCYAEVGDAHAPDCPQARRQDPSDPG
jgi:hypothetical protein